MAQVLKFQRRDERRNVPRSREAAARTVVPRTTQSERQSDGPGGLEPPGLTPELAREAARLLADPGAPATTKRAVRAALRVFALLERL
jgi:hypothetical protein